MKPRISIALLIAAMAVCLTATLHAQMQTTPILKVHIPFNFVAGGMNLPAGQYTGSHFPNGNYLLLSGPGAIAMVPIIESWLPASRSGSNKLVFNRYGDKYFLAQVWTAMDRQVHDCFKSSAELTLSRANQQPTQVAVLQ